MGDDLERRALARVGRVLDEKYSLERLLGYGGMAAVYAARHRNGHRAAVKILHPEIARNEEVRGRFLHEGYAANKVEHPGAVTVMDDDVVRDGEDKGTAYLVMELLEGESVYERVKRAGTLPEPDVLAIAEGVLDVLDAAHTRGIVHRDLKPDNLFLIRPPGEDRERVKVLDFGIARIADVARRTNIGQALGTPSYMSPEQARGQRELMDGRSDLFSLGATMFRLLTGRRIHDADSGTEILAKMATLPAPPIRTVAPQLSAAIGSIIDRALQFERDARYASAAGMRADVRALRAGQPLPSADFAPIGFSPGAEATAMGAMGAMGRAPEAATMSAPGAPSMVAAVPPTADRAAPVTPPLTPTVSNHGPPVVVPTVSQHAPVVFAAPPPSKKSKLPWAIAAFAGLALLVVAGSLVYAFSKPSAATSTEHEIEKESDEKPSADKNADPRPVLPTPEPPDPTPAVKPTAKPIAKPTAKPSAKPSASAAPEKTGIAKPALIPDPALAAPAAPAPAAPAPAPPGNGNGKAKGKDK